MNPSPPQSWSTADDALLTELWNDGLPVAEIQAFHLPGRTKNSIIGRAHRMRLPRWPGSRVRGAARRVVATYVQEALEVEAYPRCRYLHGDRPLWRQCEGVRVKGGSYCQACARRCYGPQRLVAAA